MGFIDFTNGEVLTADQMDTVLRQSVMRFTDASARDTALSAVLAEGMMAYLDDTNEVLKYDGTSWIDISGDITGVTAGTALTGGGTSGNVTLDVDLTEVQPNVITTQGDLVIGDASGDPVRIGIGSADTVLTSNGTTATWVATGGGGGFNTITEITASDSSYDVSGITGFARITIVAGGGGGCDSTNSNFDGGDGGNSSVSDGTTTTTANGGEGALISSDPRVARDNIFENSNQGNAIQRSSDNQPGRGGEIKIAYYDLTSVSSLDIVVGAGGSGFFNSPGGDGLVVLEYAS